MYFKQFILLFPKIGKPWPDSRTIKKKKEKKSVLMFTAKAFMREMQSFQKAEFKIGEK